MWGAIIQAILGLGTAAYGAYQKGNASKLSKANSFTNYNIPSQFYDNVGLAEQQAQSGIDPQTLAFLAQQNQQNLTASSNAILQGGGGVNQIANLYNAANAQNAQLAQFDQQLKLQKLNTLMETRKELAGQQMYKWKINQFDRWRDKAAAAAMLGAQGNKNLMSGINTAGSGLANAANYGYDSYLNNSQPNNLNKTNVGNPQPPSVWDETLPPGQSNPVTIQQSSPFAYS